MIAYFILFSATMALHRRSIAGDFDPPKLRFAGLLGSLEIRTQSPNKRGDRRLKLLSLVPAAFLPWIIDHGLPLLVLFRKQFCVGSGLREACPFRNPGGWRWFGSGSGGWSSVSNGRFRSPREPLFVPCAKFSCVDACTTFPLCFRDCTAAIRRRSRKGGVGS